MLKLFQAAYHRYKNNDTDKRGFTLVELVVVLLIMGILAAIAIPSAAYFIRKAEFRKNEENAKTVYLAAESMLTWYRASGEWDAFRKEVMEKGTLNTTFAGDADDKMQGRIYALVLNGRDGAASGSREQVMELLEGGAYSKDFFDASIAIEVDIETGQVYSAFYGTQCGNLTYNNPPGQGELSITAEGDARSYDSRKDVLLGYYSVEDVANVVDLKPVRLKITTISLLNRETLSLNWTSNSRHNNMDVKYVISFYIDGSDELLFTTEVELSKLGLKADSPDGSGTASGMVGLHLTRGNDDLGDWVFPMTYQQTDGGSGRLSLVLDGMMTAELMKAVEARNEAGDLAIRSFSTSITRLGGVTASLLNDPQDIYAEISVQPTYESKDEEFTEYRPSSAVRSNVENTLFASVTENAGSMEADISYFRHLSNLRYFNMDRETVFALTESDMDWVTAGMYGLSENVTRGADGFLNGRTVAWESVVQAGVVLDFPSIPLLGEKYKLDGNGNSLLNLHLGAGSMPDDGLIDKLYGELGEEEKKKNYTYYMGLFCEAEGSIEELILQDPVLKLESGEGKPAFRSLYGVGILCGRGQGSLKDISVETRKDQNNPTLLVQMADRTSGGEKSPAGIGGLVGVLAGKGSDGRLKPLTDSNVKISGLAMDGVVVGRLPKPAKPALAEGESPEDRAGEYQYGIGGIFGYAWVGREGSIGSGVEIIRCFNHADVKGNLLTGGVGGALWGGYDVSAGAADASSMENCQNEGLVLCSTSHKDEEGELEGRYFGGILGYGREAKINGAVNSSRYGGVYDDSKREELLHGQYVGGILGYGHNSQLAGCSTRKESYVFGSEYVGGIAGGLSNDLKEAITSDASGVAVTTNAGYVIGNYYVGGIVGKNDGSSSTTIANCFNNGVAAGYGRYIGGIVGYNGKNGTLKDCVSYLSDHNGTIFQTIVDKWKAKGDCAGGLAGYNNGRVEFTSGSAGIQEKSVASIVVGGNYVGGMIGFNDVDGDLDVHYKLISGSIHGYGNAVGGCIGLNASEAILGREISVQPEKVVGIYYVGGCIGANVVNIGSDKAMTGFKAVESLGSITGDSFTGGVIGYQRTYTDDQLWDMLTLYSATSLVTAPGNGGKLSLLEYIDAMEGRLPKEPESGMAGRLLPLLDADNVPVGAVVSDNANLLTIGKKDISGPEVYNTISICSDLYTGGVVGYCERGSRLLIVNCANSGRLTRRSPGQDTDGGESREGYVSLKAYLQSQELNADIGELGERDFGISMGGGIIGVNLENQIIDHCVNHGTMDGFRGLGGIVGINAGGVFNCSLKSNFGISELDYIGGIVGLNVHAPDWQGTDIYTDYNNEVWNYSSGTIANCDTAEGKTISGGSYVGGIAGYNMSKAVLRSNANCSNVTGDGDYVGGLAGANNGRIWVSPVQDDGAEYAVTGNNGLGIGGIVGWNTRSGEIDVDASASGAGNEVVAVGANVSITGKERVGGIIGIHEGKLEVSGGATLLCRARTVHATQGYVGGIIGEARPASDADLSGDAVSMRIAGVINQAVVTADNGPAGGIVAENPSGVSLEKCENNGSVNSDQGYAGGITSRNYGKIIECSVEGKNGNITIQSKGVNSIGAVCAVNDGMISDSAPAGAVTLAGTAKIIGGVAGVNDSNGEISGGSVNYMPMVNMDSAALAVGGVAGQNCKTIRGITVQNLKFEGLESRGFKGYQYLGGVTGENQDGALVEDCHFAGGVMTEQEGGGAAGNCYGGVAGKNAGTLRGCEIKSVIINIPGVYTATSTSTAKEKENFSSHVGGIAGKNEEGGRIIGCLVREGNTPTRITVGNGMAGGVAGYNKGTIMLSGDAMTKELMGQNDNFEPGVAGVQELVSNARARGIAADSMWVQWEDTGELGDQRYSDGRNKGKAVSEDRSLLLVVSTSGNLGGIAAYNAPAGRVDYCATGDWFLNNKSKDIGVGTGGVIGMNESEKNLSFLLNRAFVGRQLSFDTRDTNRFAGGIIGNQNNSTTSGWVISDCVNYGTVYCKYTHYSGGILGQWTGRGGSIEKCYNYGNLQTTYGAGWVGASGGIVAQLYHAHENNEYNILSCANYGNIYGRLGNSATADCANDSAGILGNITAYKAESDIYAQKFTINVKDCVNGQGVEIYSGSMASGIVGFFSCDDSNQGNIVKSTANIVLNIERCRNYAYKLQGKTFVAGIFGERYGKKGIQNTTLKYCFSVNRSSGYYNMTPYPVISFTTVGDDYMEINGGKANSDSKDNYFLSDGPDSKGGRILNSFVSTSFTTSGAKSDLERANSKWAYSFTKDKKRYFVDLDFDKRNIVPNNLTIRGNDVYNGRNKIGEVLFAIDISGGDKYGGMDAIVGKSNQDLKVPGEGFDKYVREFCTRQANMLGTPEKVVLSREEDTERFGVEVVLPDAGYTEEGIRFVASLYRKGEDGTEHLIAAEQIKNVDGSPVTSEGDGFRFEKNIYTFQLSPEEVSKDGWLFVRVYSQSSDGSGKSEVVESNLVPIGNVLQEPELRIELVGGTPAGTGTVGYGYRFRLANLDAYKNRENLEVHVKPMDGEEFVFDKDKEGFYSPNGDSLQQLLVWIKEKDGTGKGASSMQVSVPVYLPKSTPLIDVEKPQPKVAVSGTNQKDLSITVTLTGPDKSVTTPPIYRAELLGTWTDDQNVEHKDHVFRTADILTVASGESQAVFTDFGDMREEFFSAENIMVRVWYAQSGLGPVYTYCTEFLPEPPNTMTEEGTGVFTLVLKDDTFKSYRWQPDKELFTWLPAPRLMDEGSLKPEIDGVTGRLQYTFKWDDGISGNNKYLVSLKGIIIDETGKEGTPISIVTDREVEGGVLTLDAENWTYQEVEISVTRIGDTGGTQIQIGKTSVAKYNVKKRLSKPEQPKVTILDKNELDYTIEWKPVQPEDRGEGFGCVAYEIFVRLLDVQPGEPNRDKRIPVGLDEIGADNVYRKSISMEEYAGEKVLISVRAKAAADDAFYVDSVDGITSELSVPKRIGAPNIISWKSNWEYDSSKAVSAAGFQDGLKVSVEAGADSLPPGGSSYLLKAYIFDSKESAEKAMKAVDMITDSTEGLLDVYPGRDGSGRPGSAEMKKDEGGNIFSHSFTGLSAKYAGKYVVLCVRISSGGGQVSSEWCVNGEVWRLPFVVLSTPGVSVRNDVRTTEVTLIPNPDLQPGEGEGSVSGGDAGGGGSVSGGDADGTGGGNTVFADDGGAGGGTGKAGSVSDGDADSDSASGEPSPGDNADPDADNADSGSADAGKSDDIIADSGSGESGNGNTVSGGDLRADDGMEESGRDKGSISTVLLPMAAAVLSGQAGDAAPVEDGAEPLADAVEEKGLWTSENTILTWGSVEFADCYYFVLQGDNGSLMQEFKIAETKGPDAAVKVYWKDAGVWQEITGNRDVTENRDVFELSPYHKVVEGKYQQEVDYLVPYRVDLKARLEVSEQGEGFIYTLVLPDADRLTPPDGGNSIADKGLRFTESVRIWSDMEENETAQNSEAYVKSTELTKLFSN